MVKGRQQRLRGMYERGAEEGKGCGKGLGGEQPDCFWATVVKGEIWFGKRWFGERGINPRTNLN